MVGKEGLPLISDRIIIRKLTELDFQNIYHLCQDSRTGDWFPRWNMNEEQAKGFLEWQISKYQEFDVLNDAVGLAIELEDTHEFIGHGGIGKHDELDEVEIFIGIDKRYRNMNYATKAIQLLTDWAHNVLNIPALCATILEDNLASQRAVEKSGYHFIKSIMLDYMGERVSFKYYRHHI